MSLTLVVGGARSGKSAHAEALAAATGRPVRYVATADAGDPGMADRIAAHRARRPDAWWTVDAGDDLSEGLEGAGEACVLVDGLGVWVAGRLHAAGALGDGPAPAGALEPVLASVRRLADRAAARPAPTIVVCEEAGLGVLPATAGARRWVDLMGDCAQALAARADRAVLVVAGLPLELGAAGVVGAAGAHGRRHDQTAGGGMGPGDPGDPGESSSRGVRGSAGGGGDEPEGDELRRHGDAMVPQGAADHAVNVIAGGPPHWLRDELRRALEEDAGAYPREDAACAAAAARHGRAPDEVVPTNGAAEALWLLGPALRPRLAACVHPGFTEAEAALRAHGIPVARALRDPAHGFALDPRAVPGEADLVVLANPGSPTGTLDPAASLLALRRPGRVLAVDEAFMDLVPGEPASLAGERLDDVIVIRSLTKSLGIPGVRAGYALAPAPLAARLRAVRPPWSAGALALAAVAAASVRPDAAALAAERAQRERADLERRLAGVAGVRVWPGAANFCLVEVADGPAALARLGARGIAVRPCAGFPGLGPGHLRLTARGAEENRRLVEALAEAVPAWA